MIFKNQNILDLLKIGFKNYPNKLAIKDINDKDTYDDLIKSINTNSNNLIHIGLKKEDRVILIFENSVKYMEAYFSILNCGGIVVPLDSNVTENKLKKIVEISKAKGIYSTGKILASFYSFLTSSFLTKPKNFIALTDDKVSFSLIKINKSYFIHNETITKKQYELPSVTRKDISSILFTTGSSGIPKGVTLTHDNILQTIKNICDFVPYDNKYHELIILPLSHSFGLNHVLCNLSVGGTVSLANGMLRMKSIFILLADNVNGFPASPNIFEIMFHRYKIFFIESAKNLKFSVVNSAPLPPNLSMKIMKTFPHIRLYVYYGLTEASRSTFILHSKKNKDLLGSVGQASPNVKISVLNDEGHIVTNNANGEVLIRGKNVMRKYWGDDKSTGRQFIKGWLKTGDIGFINKNGFLFIKGRIKDMINIGGLKTSSHEINNVFVKMKGIKDFHALGLNNTKSNLTGEKIIALVVENQKTTLLLDDYLSYGRLKLEEYKIPKEYFIVDKIPRSETGKPLLNLIINIINNKKYVALKK